MIRLRNCKFRRAGAKKVGSDIFENLKINLFYSGVQEFANPKKGWTLNDMYETQQGKSVYFRYHDGKLEWATYSKNRPIDSPYRSKILVEFSQLKSTIRYTISYE